MRNILDSTLDHKEELNNRKETRRHQSLDKLLENDDFLIVSNEAGPLEILIQKEQFKPSLPLSNILTDKQRKALELYYLQGYNKAEVARILKTDNRAVRRLLKRGQVRVLRFLLN